MSKPHRSAAAAVLLLGGHLLAYAGCASVLDVDGYKSAGVELCDLLGRCYSGGGPLRCDDRIDGRLDGAGEEARGSWLRFFADASCLESCASARRCLDLRPVCGTQGEVCGSREECCGFTTGEADCDPSNGQCCLPFGMPCGGDGAACCAGSGGCQVVAGQPDRKTCGGVVCLKPGEGCANSFECCTGICGAEGTCAVETCAPDGFPCGSSDDCCSGYCDPLTAKCGEPKCTLDGGVCKGSGDCCSGYCYLPEGASHGLCSQGDCYPDGYDCAADAQCCTHYCDLTYFRCGVPKCSALGEPCGTSLDCCSGGCKDGACAVCSVDACETDDDCCEGECAGGSCTTACKEPVCEDVCEARDDPYDTACPGADPCIAAICEVDPFCCCIAWDAICVDEVGTYCPEPCAPRSGG